jgi:hypothetical protein
MNLRDILPQNAEALHRMYHQGGNESKDSLEARKQRLMPFAECFKRCIVECGPLTNDPMHELFMMMMTVTLIDYMIEGSTKKDAVV